MTDNDDWGATHVNPENTPANQLGSLAVGLYAWLTAVSFGLAVLDIVYARLVPGAAAAFSEVADFLLVVNAVTVLAALGAIGLSWNSSATRSLLIASVGVIVLGFLAYMFLSPFRLEGSTLGPGIRIILAGAVSLLAFAGFAKMRTCL